MTRGSGGGAGAIRWRALLGALALVGVVPAAQAAAITGLQIDDDRIVIRFDERVDGASTLLLDGPRRIAVDITGVTGAATLQPDGPVQAIRQGPHGANVRRLVFDLAEPRLVTSGKFEDDGRRLVLRLKRVDERVFARASGKRPLDLFPFSLGEGDQGRYTVAQAVPPPRRLPLPRVDGDETRPLVVIDAGHGGVDPGAISPTTGLREKDVTLAIAKAIRDELLKSGRVRVALTRSDDRFLILRERFGIARRLHGDLFISIHCDSVGAGDASGASAYTLSEVASDKEAARLAARENKADVIAGVNLGEQSADVSSILIDLTQRETMNASAGFARLLGREAQPLIPVKPTFHKMASLMVLKAPDMPSILFETGYISNPKDAAFLNSDAGRKRIAQAVEGAVEVFFARRLVGK